MREHAQITKVKKQGEAYMVEGVAEGRKVSFFATAESVESMKPAEAEAFFKRSIRSQAERQKEEGR